MGRIFIGDVDERGGGLSHAAGRHPDVSGRIFISMADYFGGIGNRADTGGHGDFDFSGAGSEWIDFWWTKRLVNTSTGAAPRHKMPWKAHQGLTLDNLSDAAA